MAKQQMLDPSNVSKLGLGLKDTAHVADMTVGATLGVGVKSISLDAATPLVMPPVMIVVLQAPMMYDKQQIKIDTLKALLETHATAVNGIDVEYNIDTADSPVGHDGQVHQVPTQNKRSAVNPSFTIPEVTGNLVWRFFNQWGFDMCHPDTNASFSHLSEKVAQALPFVSSSYSMTMAAIQFDPSGIPENIIDGAFYSNMFPTAPGGAIGFEKTIGTSNTRERSITFSAHLRHNEHTRDLMIDIAKQLKLGNVRKGPNPIPLHKDVKDYVKLSGIMDEVAAIGKFDPDKQ